MKVVVQRVKTASVKINLNADKQAIGKITNGLLVFLEERLSNGVVAKFGK